MIRAIILFTLSAVLVSSCVISKHSNMGFVKNSHIESDAEVFSVSASTFIARPIVKKALQDDGDSESEAISELVSQLRGIRVLVIENQQDYTKINKRLDKHLKRKNYEEWISVNSDGDRVNINAKMKADKIKRLLIAVSSEDGDGVFVRLKGKFDLNKMLESVGTLTDNGLKMRKKQKEVSEL